MTRHSISDETVLIRDAIKVALDTATEPLTSDEVARHPEVQSLGLPHDMVSRELKALYDKSKKAWPLLRIPSSKPGRNKWEYFNPRVVKLAHKEKAAPAPVNDVKSEPVPVPEFTFNPVEFVPEPVAAPDVSVPVPAGVKSVTLSVAGVTIKIELGV